MILEMDTVNYLQKMENITNKIATLNIYTLLKAYISSQKTRKIMEKEDDGFVISEEDFKLRGQGDLFGTKQSGDMSFKIASIKHDYKILLQAKKTLKNT